jgi:hypothetical protein
MKKLNTINKIRSATKLFTLGLAASAALMAGSAQAATYANWTFNDGTGADSSGNGHDLGGQNGPVIASPAGWGPSPNCTSHGPGAREGFEAYLDLSAQGLPTDNFTLGGYFMANHPSYATGTQSSVLATDADSVNSLWIGSRQVDGTTDEWVVFIGGPGGTLLANFPVTPGTAQHIEVTREAGAYSVWLDNTLVAGPTAAGDFTWSSFHFGVNSGGGTGYNGLFGDITLTDVVSHSPEAKILTFGLPGMPAVINQATTNIAWTVPHGTAVANLAPTYTLATGATCDKAPSSTQDFSSPVAYTVISSDLLLTNIYTVTVTVAPPPPPGIRFDAASSKSQGGGLSSIEWSHSVSAFDANRMLVVGITTESDPDSTVTGVTFGAQALTQVAGARAVQGTAPANASDLWYLPAPALGANTITVTFSDVVGAGTVAGAVSLLGVVQGPPEAVATYAAPSGTSGAYSAAITTLSCGAWLVDAVNNGTVGATFTPTSGQTGRWYSGGVNHAGAGSTRELGSVGATTDTWTTSGGSRRALSVAAFAPVTPLPPAADIVAFGFPGNPAIITGTNIVLTVPYGSVAALAPIYTLTCDATCPTASGSAQDFTSPVHYIVTSSDSLIIKDYKVTVIMRGLPTTNTYNLGAQDSGTSIGNGAVRPAAWIAKGTLPPPSILKSTSINARLDTFGGGDTWASDLAAYVDPGTPPPPSGTALLQVGGYDAIGGPVTKLGWGNGDSGAIGATCIATKTAPGDFPDAINLNTAGLYLANGGWAPASWSGTISVVYEVPPATILALGLPGIPAVIDYTTKTIALVVPYGTDLTTLAPTFTLSSGTCAPASGVAPTPSFAVNNTATYRVIDELVARTNDYTVTVTVPAAPSTACDMLTFNANLAGSGAIIRTTSPTAGTVVVYVPFGTTEVQVAALAPTYTLSALATCNQPNSTIPSPALSTTIPVHYIVKAQDGVTTKDYTVTVTVDGLITPIEVTAQSYYAPGDRAPVRAIDGSGMTPKSPVRTSSTCGNNPAARMWLSDNTPATWITFDLGSVQTIAGFHLWNYNENDNFPGRGVQTASIYAGTTLLANGADYYTEAGAAWGTLVEDMTFTMAPGAAGYAGEDYLFATPVTTRYIQIYVTSNFGTSDAYTGISEIRFIPPATILSFGANVAGSSAVIGGPSVGGTANIVWTVPDGTVLATLSPTYTLSSGTCPQPNDGSTLPTPTFPGPVTYTVTDTDTGTINVYTVSVVVRTYDNGFEETIFDDPAGNAQNDIEGYRKRALSIGASDAQGILTGTFSYPNDAAFDTRAAELGAVGFDSESFAALWITGFRPDETGAWGFRFDNVDDDVSFWIDMDGNGVFEIGNRFYYRGCCAASGDQYSPSVTAGTTYLFGIPFRDGGGGGLLLNMQFKRPSGDWTTINPSDPDQDGLWRISPQAWITSFGANVAGSSAVIGAVVGNKINIVWTVAYSMTQEEIAALAPQYTLSTGAICTQPNGGIPTPNFGTGPVDYTVISSDGAIATVYTVTVTKAPAPVGYSALALATDPTVYWPLHEPAGPTAFDYTGANNATYSSSGVAYGVPGPVGSVAVSLDGADGTKIVAPYSAALNPSGPFTVECWINPANTTSGSRVLVIDMINGQNLANTGDRSGWAFRQSGATLQFLIGDDSIPNGGYSLTATTPAVLTAGSWQHVLATYDSATTNVSIWVNGSSVLSQTGPKQLFPNFAAPTMIGDRGYGGWRYNGSIAHVALYNRLLTAQEIQSHAQYRPILQIGKSGSDVVLRWDGVGTLQAAPVVTGP